MRLSRSAMAAHIIPDEVKLLSVAWVVEDAVEDYSGERKAMQEDDVRVGWVADGLCVNGCSISG